MTDITDKEAAAVAAILISAEEQLGRIDNSTNRDEVNKVVFVTLRYRLQDQMYTGAKTRSEQLSALVLLLSNELEKAKVLNRSDRDLTSTEYARWEALIDEKLQEMAK